MSIPRQKKRDLSLAQFHNALEREGFSRPKFFGYVDLGPECGHRHVSIWNAPSDRRRDQLAYLKAQKRRLTKQWEMAS